MSKIYEKIGGCLNNVKPESINPKDTVYLYSLRTNERLVDSIEKADWDKEIKNKNNVLIIERSEYFSIQHEELLIFYMTNISKYTTDSTKICASTKKSAILQMIFATFCQIGILSF